MSDVSAFDDADEAGEDGGVEQVNEERAHHRHNQEGFVRRAESLGNGLHVGNGSRGGAQTEAAVAGCQDGGVVVAAHEDVGNEGCVQNHHDGLYGQDDGYGACQTGQFPQFQVQKGHGEEERQGGVTEYVDGAVEHIDFEGCSQDVADDHAGKQTPYEFRQVEEGFVVAVDDFGKSQTCGKHRRVFRQRSQP